MPALKVLLQGCAGIFLGACWLTVLAQEGGEGPPPAPVVVAEALEQRLAPATWYPGTVISRNQARLSAEVEGRLEWVAEVGDLVERGIEVARLDSVMLEQALIESKAQVARERARLGYLDAEVKRLEKLRTQGTSTQSQLEQAIADRGVTRSEVAAARARVALANERIERSVTRAPFTGVVVERYLQAGEWAESGEAVLRLVDTVSIEVQAWVPVVALTYIQSGSELTIESNPHEKLGRVRTIVPVGDTQSRLYELRVTVSETWPVGQSLRVAIPTAQARRVVAIPRDALVLRREGTHVFRIDAQGLAERVDVQVGLASGELIEVSGIVAGDRVVTRGGERLRPGQTVKIIPSASQ